VYSKRPCEQKPFENLGVKGPWAYPGTAQFLGVLYYPKIGKATNFKFGRYIYRVNPNKSPLKILGKRNVGVSRDCRNVFSTSIISGTGKATNFKFSTHILSIDRNKSQLQISGNVAVGVVRTLEIFQGTPILGASRGRLCDSSGFLFYNVTHSKASILYISSVCFAR